MPSCNRIAANGHKPRQRLRKARRVLAAGGLVAHPTEGVWGLACNPLSPEAVFGLLAVKRRSPAKGLILIAAHPGQLAAYLQGAPPAAAAADWPGPTTWLLAAAADLPWWLSGEHKRIAVRVTAHPLAAALCRAWGGPLVSTSANLAGHPPALFSWQVRRQLGSSVNLILAGDLDCPGRPSAIRSGDGCYLRGGPP